MMVQLHASSAARILLDFDIGKGFSLVRQDLRSSAEQILPLEPEAVEALIGAWPAFKEKALGGAPVTPADEETLYRAGSRASPAPISSPSSPNTRSSGSGDQRWASERGKPAASSPGAPKTLL